MYKKSKVPPSNRARSREKVNIFGNTSRREMVGQTSTGKGEKMNIDCKLSLDRLTFCGNVAGSLDKFIEKNEYIERRGFAKYPYRDSIHFIDGSILQIAEIEMVRNGKIKELRYEFNPNNEMFEKVHISVLKMLKDVHVTRCDIALDVFDVDMSSWKWFDRLSRPQRHYVGGTGKFETVYIGGSHSELILRIYDKAKEQKEKEKTWWRVEVQMRGDWSKHFQEWSGRGVPPINPFDDIAPLLMNTQAIRRLPIRERAMVKELIAEPSGWSELSGKTRTKYKKMIRELSEKEPDKIDLSKMWKEKSPDMASELQSWLTYPMANER